MFGLSCMQFLRDMHWVNSHNKTRLIASGAVVGYFNICGSNEILCKLENELLRNRQLIVAPISYEKYWLTHTQKKKKQISGDPESLQKKADVETTKPTTLLTMKYLLIIALSLFYFDDSSAQKIYSVDYESQADIKVFVVDYESQADLKVFKVEYQSQVGHNNGNWFFTDYASQADSRIYFVDYKSQADLKIYFVDYKSQAGWKNSSKKHLMY